MITIITVIAVVVCAFLLGIFFRPLIIKFFKNKLSFLFEEQTKRYEIEFKIEFYSQPSIHHLGETGILVKTEPIKVQVDADTEDEALSTVDQIVKQEVKSELLSIKEIPRIN